MNLAVKAIVDVMMDCEALEMLRGEGRMRRKNWDKLVSREVSHRLMGQGQIQATTEAVLLTLDGAEVIGYKEILA